MVSHVDNIHAVQVRAASSKPRPQHSLKENKRRSANILCSPGVGYLAPRPVTRESRTRASKRARSVNLASRSPICVEEGDQLRVSLAEEAAVREGVALIPAPIPSPAPAPTPAPFARVSVAAATGCKRQRTKQESLGSAPTGNGIPSTCVTSLAAVGSARRMCISGRRYRADKRGKVASGGRSASVDGALEDSPQVMVRTYRQRLLKDTPTRERDCKFHIRSQLR